MTVAVSPRFLFPLEQRTWVSILLIGVGFGVVASVALFVSGAVAMGVFCLFAPVVFGCTATAIHSRPALRPTAVVLNWVLVILSALRIAQEVSPLLNGGIQRAHPAVLLVIGMSVLLQMAVVVVACESLRRLRGSRNIRLGEGAGGTS